MAIMLGLFPRHLSICGTVTDSRFRRGSFVERIICEHNSRNDEVDKFTILCHETCKIKENKFISHYKKHREEFISCGICQMLNKNGLHINLVHECCPFRVTCNGHIN